MKVVLFYMLCYYSQKTVIKNKFFENLGCGHSLLYVIIHNVKKRKESVVMSGRKIISIIMGIFMIMTGIICITSPTMTYGTIAWVLGFSMLLESIANIANWDERKSLGFANGWDLVGSIISLILSIILIFSNVLQATVDLFILIIAAIWLIVIGIVRIVTSFKVKKLHDELNTLILGKHWYIALILGIIMIIAGILCLMHPVVLAITIGVYIGIEIIIAGIELITYAV